MDKGKSTKSATEKHVAKLEASRFLSEWLERRRKPQCQSIKFEEAARELEADENEKRLEERLKRVARAKDLPVPEPKGPLRSKPKAD